MMKRNDFLKISLLGASGLMLSPLVGRAQDQTEPPPLKLEMVKEFVVAGHGNLDKVKSMLNDFPNLIYSRYDWGNGDFEEAIEGAGHLGNKEIANYLIEKGARVNLFLLTMLGKTELVKPVLESYPKLITALGPHGFTLLHHAKVGGDDSKSLFDYLQQKGLTEMKVNIK
jgi:ankyrin repeat protein